MAAGWAVPVFILGIPIVTHRLAGTLSSNGARFRSVRAARDLEMMHRLR